MRASSVLCSCRRRAARFGDRSARILLTAILPAAPPSLGWFGRCAAARPRSRPRPRARLRPVHATAHKAPADRVDSGRTRCDSLTPRSQALPGNAMPAGSACIPSNALPGAGGGASPAVRSQAEPGNEGGINTPLTRGWTPASVSLETRSIGMAKSANVAPPRCVKDRSWPPLPSIVNTNTSIASTANTVGRAKSTTTRL